MLKFFRSIRKKLLKESKFKNYIIYAIGEILLVMIGILLALQFNNWNSNRQAKNTLKNTLKIVVSDLKRDTITAMQLIKIMDVSQKTGDSILAGKVTLNNVGEYPRTRSLVTLYQPFNIQTKGYDILKSIADQKISEQDSVFDYLTQFYTLFSPNLQKSNERLEDVVIGNLNDFKEYSWFVEWTQGKVNDEMIAYFVTSEDYKKRVAAYNVLAFGNHYALLNAYKDNAKVMLEMLEKRIKED